MSVTQDRRPTARQLNYLRILADRTATTFVTPNDRREASAEIQRLRALRKRKPAAGRDMPPAHHETSQRYATAPAPDEIAGYGSSARWAKPKAEDFADGPSPKRVGPRTELARYSVSGADRVIYGQRIDGAVRVTDCPDGARGRSYLIDRELQHDGQGALDALVADYIDQAHALDAIPMASSAVRQAIEHDATT
jgi:hypothetical protein